MLKSGYDTIAHEKDKKAIRAAKEKIIALGEQKSQVIRNIPLSSDASDILHDIATHLKISWLGGLFFSAKDNKHLYHTICALNYETKPGEQETIDLIKEIMIYLREGHVPPQSIIEKIDPLLNAAEIPSPDLDLPNGYSPK